MYHRELLVLIGTVANVIKNNRQGKYLLAFFTQDGGLLEVLACSSLNDYPTWEAIDANLDVYARFIMLWKLNGASFSVEEGNQIFDFVSDEKDPYLVDDMKIEGRSKLIMKTLTPNCLLIGWAPIVLPSTASTWSDFELNAKQQLVLQ